MYLARRNRIPYRPNKNCNEDIVIERAVKTILYVFVAFIVQSWVLQYCSGLGQGAGPNSLLLGLQGRPNKDLPLPDSQARGSFHVLLDTHLQSLSTSPRIVELFHQDNSWQQLLLLFRSYLGSIPYWAALHGPLRRPLTQRWGQLYKLSLTGEQVQFLSERKKEKQSQDAPGKSATTPQPNSPRVSENAALLDALRETIRTVNEHNARIRALEDGQRQILGYIKPSSPLRRAERSESPPARRAGTSQRRPVLESVQPQVQKRNRTPPREDAVARANKRGKVVALFEQRPRSPRRKKEILLGGMTQGSQGDDYQYRRENSPRREETPIHSPGWSDDEVYKGPLSRQIMDLELPRALQKPPQLGKYDGLTDPDIHIQNIDAILNYQAVKGGIKCRIFPTTLVEVVMAWYRSLPQGSITSWKDLCKQFTSHFTASRKHPKTEANLEAVRQGPNETFRSYIERFNKEAVQVDVTDDMKKYPMRKNLRDGTNSRRKPWLMP
ncbi:hypothetical protein TSUD_101190 [Trifolium subterraneum]|uniref:Retrotransposon gag domain-containing protein n=1 Tax=Trifolium subterraneum TaxID=3900 RepID=A0A2Z6NT70_TRISU|nr:hypothetical protein TSUD_101190 [Trifolium subterraneum]